MFISYLVIIYSILILLGAGLVSRKKKIGFIISTIGCLLQLLHVILVPALIGMLIMTIGFTCISIIALMSRTWRDESWM